MKIELLAKSPIKNDTSGARYVRVDEHLVTVTQALFHELWLVRGTPWVERILAAEHHRQVGRVLSERSDYSRSLLAKVYPLAHLYDASKFSTRDLDDLLAWRSGPRRCERLRRRLK